MPNLERPSYLKMQSLLLLTVLICLARARPYIESFKLANPTTNSRIRSLFDYDVIATRSPFTIEAVVDGTPRPVNYVTFISPFYHREFFIPYALGGDKPVGNYFPVDLPQGEHLIHAYPNENKDNGKKVLVRVLPNFPRVGPLPTEVVPQHPGQLELAVPEASSTCKRKGSPGIQITSIELLPFSSTTMGISVRPDWCSTKNDKLRIRLISFYRNGNGAVKTTVFAQKLIKTFRKYDFMSSFQSPRFCKDRYFFAEACVSKKTSIGKPEVVCSTSSLRWIPKYIVPEPRLKWRPPIFIQVSPGDSFRVRTETWIPMDDPEKTNGFSNDDFDTENRTYALRGVAESVDGSISTTPWSTNRSVVIRVPTQGGVTLVDNGTLLYTNYSLASCRSNHGSWKERYNTTILVSANYERLIKQDTALPTFAKPVYPETIFNMPARITVEAKNPGGGMRQGGIPTELHYQWYLRTEKGGPGTRTYAEPIPGATKPTLVIPKAECSNIVPGKFGTHIDLRLYYVDVCNTFGCRRSDEIVPNILPPEGHPNMIFLPFVC